MKKRFSIAAVLALCLVTAAVTYLISANAMRNNYESKLDKTYSDMAPFSKLFEINSFVQQNFIGEIDEEALVEGTLKGYFTGLGDKYSMYHNKEYMDSWAMSNSGDFVGIGVVVSLDIDTETIYVRRTVPGSPAEKAGILPGDLITAVDGNTVTQATYNDCVNLVRGSEGTSVSLAVKRGDRTFDLSVERAVFKAQNVYMEYLEGNIAHITITEFEGNTADDFIACMNEAQSKNVAGYVFDLRNNPGGNLDVICATLDYLLPSGPIIRVKDAAGNLAYTRNSGESHVEAPMVVLVNENTASAAELFTAALRDYKMAEIVGTTTYGKGTIQNIITLPDGTGFRLSTFYYEPPYSGNYNGVGIVPDVVVDHDEYYKKRPHLLNESNDKQIMAAKQSIADQIAKEK